MPISECEAFWEAFKWLAIILIIPALIFGGPIALIALGVNLALFIKTIVDVAKGDASFLDLFLAGLGLIAPTTKALPIFSIIKAVGKGIAAGVKGIAQTFKTVFSKDFLFSGLLTGLKSMRDPGQHRDQGDRPLRRSRTCGTSRSSPRTSATTSARSRSARSAS